MIKSGLNISCTPHSRGEILGDIGDGAHLWKGLERHASEMRVREHDCGRESTEDDVSELDATRRDRVAEREVVLTEEVREIVEDDQEQAKDSTVEVSFGLPEVSVFQEGLKELEEGEQEFVEGSPTLTILRE